MNNVPLIIIVIILAVCFFAAYFGTRYALRALRPQSADDDGRPTEEAEALRERAERNVEGAEDIAARAKRLEQLLELQKRNHIRASSERQSRSQSQGEK